MANFIPRMFDHWFKAAGAGTAADPHVPSVIVDSGAITVDQAAAIVAIEAVTAAVVANGVILADVLTELEAHTALLTTIEANTAP